MTHQWMSTVSSPQKRGIHVYLPFHSGMRVLNRIRCCVCPWSCSAGYSFILWEMATLHKPFAQYKMAEFVTRVFRGGECQRGIRRRFHFAWSTPMLWNMMTRLCCVISDGWLVALLVDGWMGGLMNVMQGNDRR